MACCRTRNVLAQVAPLDRALLFAWSNDEIYAGFGGLEIARPGGARLMCRDQPSISRPKFKQRENTLQRPRSGRCAERQPKHRKSWLPSFGRARLHHREDAQRV